MHAGRKAINESQVRGDSWKKGKITKLGMFVKAVHKCVVKNASW